MRRLNAAFLLAAAAAFGAHADEVPAGTEGASAREPPEAVAGTGDAEPPMAVADPDYVEEVIVTAEPPRPGAVPSPLFIAETYYAMDQGTLLYKRKMYKEALPYLLAAARRGFKWEQARAADILIYGRGGVEKDIEAGIGWLATAADGRSSGPIRRYFKEIWENIPERFRPHFQPTIDEYREKYAATEHRVGCEMSGGEAGAMTLRMKNLHCRFIDEASVCRILTSPYMTLTERANQGEIVEFEWYCPAVKGSRQMRTVPAAHFPTI